MYGGMQAHLAGQLDEIRSALIRSAVSRMVAVGGKLTGARASKLRSGVVIRLSWVS